MRLFCHISEFGPAGIQSLPCMTFLSEKVVLWAPSASFIDKAYRSEDSYLCSQDILELVKAGHIQIMGRKLWLTNPNSRAKSNWPFAAWDDRFDAVLAEIGLAEDREKILETERKVRFAVAERGWRWADEVMSSSFTVDKCRVEQARKYVQERRLPQGTLDKIEQEQSIESQVRVVLRDVRNHVDAFVESGATLPAVLSDSGEAIADICGYAIKAMESTNLPRVERLVDVIHLLSSISKPRTAAEFQKLLLRKDRPTLIKEIGYLVQNDAPIARLLGSQIEMGTKEPSWLRSLVPDSSFQVFCTLAGLAIAVATFQLTAEPILSLLIELLGTTEGSLEKLSILPASQYIGPKLPFMLAYDCSNPLYKQIRELHQKLISL